jgi:hypothetical protein
MNNYEDKAQKKYNQRPKAMKISVFNLIMLGIILIGRQLISYLASSFDPKLGSVMVGIGFAIFILTYFYYKYDATARGIIIGGTAFSLIFFNYYLVPLFFSVSLLFVDPSVFILLTAIYNGFITQAIFQILYANLINEDTKHKFQHPDLIPSNLPPL